MFGPDEMGWIVYEFGLADRPQTRVSEDRPLEAPAVDNRSQRGAGAGPAARCGGGDLHQVQVHRLGVAGWQDQGCTLTLFGQTAPKM